MLLLEVYHACTAATCLIYQMSIITPWRDNSTSLAWPGSDSAAKELMEVVEEKDAWVTMLSILPPNRGIMGKEDELVGNMQNELFLAQCRVVPDMARRHLKYAILEKV